jgi:RHS repeat-associated protein
VNGKFDPSKTVTSANIAPYISTIRTIWWDGDETTGSLSSNYYLFTGRRSDPESGLMYFRNRYYSPELGRFATRDPSGYADGMSLYQAYFVPNWADAYGLESEMPAPNVAPCQYLGSERGIPSGVSAPPGFRVEGFVEAKANPEPGVKDPKPCCVCGKPGIQWSTKKFKCSVKIWIAKGIDPNRQDSYAKHTTWQHESISATYYAEYIKNLDEMYKQYARLCIPAKCEKYRTAYWASMGAHYFAGYLAKDAWLNVDDYPPNAKPIERAKAVSLDAKKKKALQEATKAFQDGVECVRKEGGCVSVGGVCPKCPH